MRLFVPETFCSETDSGPGSRTEYLRQISDFGSGSLRLNPHAGTRTRPIWLLPSALVIGDNATASDHFPSVGGPLYERLDALKCGRAAP